MPGKCISNRGAWLLPEEAFRRYEQQMYAYVRRQQKSACGFATSFLPGTRFGLLVQQTMMNVLFRETFRGLLRRQFGAQSILPPQDARPEPADAWQERLPHQ